MSSSVAGMRGGLYAEALVGLNLTAGEKALVLDERALSLLVASEIRAALQSARSAGINDFPPDSPLLAVDPALSDRVRDLFVNVLRTAYEASDDALALSLSAYGSLNFPQWSALEDRLSEHAARLGSMLGPGQGGGPQQSRGKWYVNGQGYSLAEVVMTIRVGNLNGLDQVLGADLNTLLANTTLARQLMSLIGDMKRRLDQREVDALEQQSPIIELNTVDDYLNPVNAAGLTVDQLQLLGQRFKGEAQGYLYSLGNLVVDDQTPIPITTTSDYSDAITELQSIFDSINSQNDIKRVQIEARQNERNNMLEGLSTFHNGIKTVNQSVSINL